MKACRSLRSALRATVVVALLAACVYETHGRRLTIAPDPVPCADRRPGSCLSVTDAAGDTWIAGPDQIEGFAYEPGFTYELLVEEPSEAAAIEAGAPPPLRLIQVLSRQAGGASGAALDAGLEATRWRLRAIQPSDHPEAAWATSGITAQFDLGANRLSGSAGCNNYFAALTVWGDRLEVSPPAATKKACPAPLVMELEREYLERIASAQSYAIAGDRLDLSLSDGSGMAFRAARP